jgi:hypothetical protein
MFWNYELEVWIHWYYSHIDNKWWYSCDTEWYNINFNNSGQSSDHVNSSSCLFKTDRGQLLNICLFRSISELIRMLRKHWWNFYLHQRIFLFLTDLLGYMIIQIIYKQLLLTHSHIVTYSDIKRELQGDRHEYNEGLMPPWKYWIY